MSKVFLKDKVPAKYDRAVFYEMVDLLERRLNLFSQYKGEATAAPTFGAYARGDWYKNSLPSPSGWFGWECVASGSPGTWKGFGLIEG
jgi:hypothetical protein